jgi:hypothetical protein
MVMMMNEPRSEPRSGSPPDVLEEDDDLDGWGPVRPRRSSMPVPLSAESANPNDAHVHDGEDAATRHKSPLKI